MTVNNENIIIRAAVPEDAEEILRIYAPYVINTAITFEYDVPSVSEFKERIENTLKRYPYLVAVENGRIIGYAYAGTFHARPAYDWAVETSIYVDMELMHKGLGKKLYEAMENVLSEMGILNMNACIAYPEVPDDHLSGNSKEFHEHLGYRLVGEFKKCGYKFNTWYNMVWMEKHIGEHLKNQPPVKTFDEVREAIAAKYGIF
ncbi:MAG: GNAT family N-acetyltransferase [Eubacteriales bacterium]|nr:GNAT family N-acetyltransferase [Eubacteriales bacterium]